MTTISTDFSAKEPSLGYFYQIKFALYILLVNARELDNPKLKIENLDDVEIEDVNSLSLYQTKLHIKNKGNLTNSSVDFWKTIRIWSQHIIDDLIDIDNTILNLVTTENVPESSLLIDFKANIDLETKLTEIIESLDKICLESTNQTNLKAYEAFQNLSVENKKKLIKSIRIIDNSVGIEDINEKIKKQLALSTYPSHLDAFLEILEGWWFGKAIENLTEKIDYISFSELQIKIANIRDSFQADNLPNHFPEQLDVSDEDVDTLRNKTFLKQLEIIQINTNSNTVKRAISDYRRAFEQRSKWLRLDLLNPEEEEDYDKRLQDHWRNIFEIMCDEANEKEIDEIKQLGKTFYIDQFAKNCPQVKIREKFNEDFLTRGSYQILADSKKVGWHPNFKSEL